MTPTASLSDLYAELLRVARHCSRSAEEARDLVQDVFEMALARGVDDWAAPGWRAWLRGGSSPQIVFGLDDGGIDDAVEALASNGVQVLTPVSEAPGGWSVEFGDPDGHPLAFYQDGALPRRR